MKLELTLSLTLKDDYDLATFTEAVEAMKAALIEHGIIAKAKKLGFARSDDAKQAVE